MQLEQTELLKKFSELVVEKNKVHNLTSAKTPEEFFRKHVGDCIGAPIQSPTCFLKNSSGVLAEVRL